MAIDLGLLRPLYSSHDCWTNKIAEADRWPTLYDAHGLHCFYNKAEALIQRPPNFAKLAFCEVKCSGPAVLHEYGFRVARAKIVSCTLFLNGATAPEITPQLLELTSPFLKGKIRLPKIKDGALII